MAYCRKCGEFIDDEAVICPKCGVQQAEFRTAAPNDDGSVLWLLIGFLIPVAGIILWIMWKDEKPRSARMAGAGFLAGLMLWLIGVMAVMSMIGSMMHRGERHGILQEMRGGHRRRGRHMSQVRGPAGPVER